MKKILAQPAIAGVLRSMGIDPFQYALLLELFSKLRGREEFEFGEAHIAVAKFAGFFAIFSALINLLVVFLGAVSLEEFVWGNYLFTAILVLITLASEAVNTFLNPVEAAALAHHPIREKSYFAAKLTYLCVLVALVVFPINIIPALAALNLKGARGFYPVLHLASAYLLGILIALTGCGILGLAFRVFPAARIRGAVVWLGVASFTFMSIGPQLARLLRGVKLTWNPIYSSAIPVNWFVRLALSGSLDQTSALHWPAIPSMILCAAVVYYGISWLTHGYLTQVQTLLRSGPSTRHGRSGWMGNVIRVFTDKPAGRAAFGFTYSMARTDWQFRRTVYPMLIQFMILPIGMIARTGLRASPFRPGPPSMAHFLPHLMGLVGLLVCSFITYSSQHRGAWIFLMAPLDGIHAFVKGIFWALWLPMAALPILVSLVLAWFWGPADAILFAVYSIAVVSFYLSWELLLIDGLPFANPPRAGRGGFAAPLVIAALIGAFIIVGLQWLFIFQSRFVTLGAALAFAGSAYLIARVSLRNLEVNVTYNLHTIASGPTTMFKEVL
jgi:hypothetical protein